MLCDNLEGWDGVGGGKEVQDGGWGERNDKMKPRYGLDFGAEHDSSLLSSMLIAC